MEFTPLVLDGIENKVKKVIFHNSELKEENQKLLNQQQELEDQITQLTEKNRNLEDQIDKLKVAKTLSGKDNFQARQQINDLLREIDKCYALLNR